MRHTQDDEGLPDLTELGLIGSALADVAWVGDLAQLPEEAILEIRATLKRRLTGSEADLVLLDLKRNFSSAVEMANAECLLRQTADKRSTGSKKSSAKMGVHLRAKLGKLRAEFENDAQPDSDDICGRILKDPVLENLVTPLIEERLRLEATDPLRYSTSLAIQKLPQALDQLYRAIDQGVVTGKAEPSLSFLAECVVRAIAHATGSTPGWTWDEYAGEEKGIGVETCRILAAALNNALPKGSLKGQPADMAKPYRNAIEFVREVD